MAVKIPSKVLVLVLPQQHLLDLAGPVQAVFEAAGFGAPYRLRYVSERPTQRSAQGLQFSSLEPLPAPQGDEWILVPGTESTELDALPVPKDWLWEAAAKGARISSICSGAFALAVSGLFEGRRCTTHWKLIEQLRAWSPSAEVLDNRLYVQDGNIISSAGLASGIDMTLAMIEVDHGPELAGRVAREMVVYLRRHGSSEQNSVYLQHRAHVHPAVHTVQDYIVEHPDDPATLSELADKAALSARQLTRVFRENTGISVKEFQQKVRLELARTLVRQSDLRIGEIAERCGFADPRQLRRLWHKEFGQSVAASRSHSTSSPAQA